MSSHPKHSQGFGKPQRVLVVFSPGQSSSSRLATVLFGKSGQVRLSQVLSEKIGLKHGDCLTFFSDKNRPQDWFVAKDPDGIYRLKAMAGQLSFFSKELCLAISESCGHPLPLKCTLGSEAIEERKLTWPIITANNLYKRR